MNEEIKKALLEYEELKIKEKEIEARIEELKPILLENLPEDKKVETDSGFFEVLTKETWVYSKAVSDLQAEEKAKGIATKKASRYIKYNLKK